MGEGVAGVSVIFSHHDGVIPDLLVVSNERAYSLEGKRLRDAPDWVVEVLSPGNAELDLETKRELYRQQGVKLYWIVDPEPREGLVFEGDNEEPTIHRKNAKVEFTLLPGLVLDGGELSKKQHRRDFLLCSNHPKSPYFRNSRTISTIFCGSICPCSRSARQPAR